MTENVQTDPIEIMRTFADTMATYGGNNLYSQGHPVVVLGVEHAQHIAAAGWHKKDIQMALFQMARRPWGIAKKSRQVERTVLSGLGRQERRKRNGSDHQRAKDLVVIVAGGAGGKSMWCPTAGAQSLSVSKVIERGA